jgi:hypothetical protein
MMEKRKDRRYTTQLHVQLDAGSKTTWGVLGDVSENGLFIKTTRDIDLDSSIDIVIFLPDNTYSHLTGIVKRKVELTDTHRKYGLGIQLIKKDERYMKLLSVSYIGQKRIA